MQKSAKLKNIRLYAGLLFLLVLPALACGEDARGVALSETAADDLSGKHFAGRYLNCRDLSHKNLQDVNFEYSELIGADFINADLRGANLNHAVMYDANFTGALLDDRWVPVVDLLTSREGIGQDYSYADLSEVFLILADLEDINLQGADLSESRVGGANLKNANLAYANLNNTGLAGANLRGADFTGADLMNASLHSADLTGAIITQAQLDSARTVGCVRMPDGSVPTVADNCLTPEPYDESQSFSNKIDYITCSDASPAD